MESCPISFYNGLRRVVLPRTDCFGQYPLPALATTAHLARLSWLRPG
jgi:hypothetical protein